ncbi:MAG: TIGR01777 family protein [Gemmatimonadaceae bacterium]|nr:TIGR01777 family protein [Gemmatimonadaceae bacterium]
MRPLTVAISGSTGLIGSALVERLTAAGHQVRRLVRPSGVTAPGDIGWDPDTDRLAPEDLAGTDTVVHLAGEPIAQRWTEARKRAIRDSRVRSTALLARTLARMTVPPAVFLSGSAVGLYGDRNAELLDEESAAGEDFLARVCTDWEAATAPAVSAGIRTVLLRTGIVLSPKGGALQKLLVPFRLGVGGPIGTGAQWMSWIALDDHVAAIGHAIQDATIRGPLNLVSPNPVTNDEFARTLGSVLERPALIPVPAFALRLVYGEMADATLLAGQRALPKALAASGFHFAHATLGDALRSALA